MGAWYEKGNMPVKECNRLLDFDDTDLSDKLKDALTYRAMGWTLQEIASTQGVTLQAVQHRLLRAIGHLHQQETKPIKKKGKL